MLAQASELGVEYYVIGPSEWQSLFSTDYAPFASTSILFM